MSAPVDISREW